MRANPTAGGLPVPGSPNTYRVLLVEDDEGDAFLVADQLRDAEDHFEIVHATTLARGLSLLDESVDCALLDLNLPDGQGLAVVDDVLERAPDLAVVVLTGWMEEQAGRDAVAAGAQDYLVKGEVDGRVLGRSLRYAIERAATEVGARELLVAAQRQRENDRLARGLLPIPLIGAHSAPVVTRYQPGGAEALLGGDFFDAVERPDGSLRLVIGDVCGHGPDEAAVGVALRISWRALVLSGAAPEAVLRGVEAVLDTEAEPVPFATVCDVEVAPDRSTMAVRLCGHPPPLLFGASPRWLDEVRPRPPLGLGAPPSFPATTVALGPRWSLLLLTDGIYEGRGPDGRLDLDGLLELAGRIHEQGARAGALLDGLIAGAMEANGGDLPDDVALLWVGARPEP